MFKVREILGLTHVLLNDVIKPHQITDDELIEYLRIAIEEVSFLDKTLFSMRRDIQLVSGTIQNVPFDCNLLIKLNYNINKDGSQGRVITYADIDILNITTANWRQDTPGSEVYNYMVGSNIKTYEVYPPQSNKPALVSADFCSSPSSNLKLDTMINLSVVFKKIFSYYIAADYLMKDTADSSNMKLGGTYKEIANTILSSAGTFAQNPKGAR